MDCSSNKADELDALLDEAAGAEQQVSASALALSPNAQEQKKRALKAQVSEHRDVTPSVLVLLGQGQKCGQSRQVREGQREESS